MKQKTVDDNNNNKRKGKRKGSQGGTQTHKHRLEGKTGEVQEKRVREGYLKRNESKRGIEREREGERGQPAVFPWTGSVEAWLAHSPLSSTPPSTSPHHITALLLLLLLLGKD